MLRSPTLTASKLQKIVTHTLSVKRNGYICTHKRTFC